MKFHRREPLALDGLLTEDERRPLSVAGHHQFRESLAVSGRKYDEVDELVDEHIQIDPYEGDPPSKRSDREINRVLSILDELEERGNG